MDVRDRVKAVLRGDMPDRVPWLIYSNHLPRGSFERRMREMGLGLDVRCTVYRAFMPNVKVESRTIGDYLYTVYRTPVGELSSRIRVGMKFQLPGGSWTVEHPVKSAKDVEVLKFMIEDTVYEPDYDNYRQIEEELEGDGIITVWADYTPLMKIIVGYMGYRNFSVIYHKNSEVIDELVTTIDRSYFNMYKILAESPAEIVRIGDNIDSVLICRNLFEKYCLPYYNKYAELLKERSKVVISHLDGRLKVLKDLIAKTKLDAIEAFTPPPMGDLPVREAKEAWKDKVVWANFPEEIFLRRSDEIRDFTLKLLEEVAPGDRFILGITEDIHPDSLKKGISIVTEVIHKYGALPIRPPLS